MLRLAKQSRKKRSDEHKHSAWINLTVGQSEVRCKVEELSAALRAKSATSTRSLEVAGQKLSAELQAQRQRDAALTDLQYEELLDGFRHL